jgi:hypothetical protein
MHLFKMKDLKYNGRKYNIARIWKKNPSLQTNVGGVPQNDKD